MILLVQHRVRDYAAWKPVFDEHGWLRAQHGATRHWLHRVLEDSNDLVIGVEFPSRQAAEGFVADPSLREAMERAGVEGAPSIQILEEVETVSY